MTVFSNYYNYFFRLNCGCNSRSRHRRLCIGGRSLSVGWPRYKKMKNNETCKSHAKCRHPHFLSCFLSLPCLFIFLMTPLPFPPFPLSLLSAHCRRVLYWWVWQDREPAAGSARSHGAADGESGEGRNSFLSARQNISHRSCEPSRGTLQPRKDCLWESEVSGRHSVHCGFCFF